MDAILMNNLSSYFQSSISHNFIETKGEFSSSYRDTLHAAKINLPRDTRNVCLICMNQANEPMDTSVIPTMLTMLSSFCFVLSGISKDDNTHQSLLISNNGRQDRIVNYTRNSTNLEVSWPIQTFQYWRFGDGQEHYVYHYVWYFYW